MTNIDKQIKENEAFQKKIQKKMNVFNITESQPSLRFLQKTQNKAEERDSKAKKYFGIFEGSKDNELIQTVDKL